MDLLLSIIASVLATLLAALILFGIRALIEFVTTVRGLADHVREIGGEVAGMRGDVRDLKVAVFGGSQA